jgi:hypothetical protein
VLDGQVDLEALGVKRLTVSQQVLDKLPIHTYTAGPNDEPEKPGPQAPGQTLDAPATSVNAETGQKATGAPLSRRSSAPTVPTSTMSTSWSQPTCPICMDDFEPNETQVRELPCHHVYHPECIDPFLLGHSSLCPMCKQSVLPTGVCPVRITNVMVRRERHINRMRARSAQAANTQPTAVSEHSPIPYHRPVPPPPALGSLGSRLGGAITGRRIFSAPERSHRPQDVEMGETPPQSASLQTDVPDTQPQLHPQDCSPTHNRREWARQRALAMLGPRHAPASDVDEEASTPRWKRVLRKVFPS